MTPPPGGRGEPEEGTTFADVLNQAFFAGGRRGAGPESVEPVVEQPAEADEWAIGPETPGCEGAAVRPYTWTRGRTRPLSRLEVETLVSTTSAGRDALAPTSAEHRAVADLCCSGRSVAEVAALLAIPLGVVRVLIADMAAIGLVTMHDPVTDADGRPDIAVLERVLTGLRQL